ncbi:MAG: S41 family peptidase [Pseudomonadota bacterium]|nr:S41 family peptidase [Pseudomonadota bacterium]
MRSNRDSNLLAIAAAFALVAAVPEAAASTQAAPVPARTASSLRDSRDATVTKLADTLEERYVFPDVAKKYAAMLRANMAAGRYSAIADNRAFAERVNADLRAVAFDGHLRLVPAPEKAGGPGGPGGGGRGKMPDAIQAQVRLPGNVAYVRYGVFTGQPDKLAAIQKFFAANRDAKTVIIDARTHIGGGLSEMDVIFPYLFDKETVLLGLDRREGVPSPGEGPAVRGVAVSPPGVVRSEHFVTPAHGSPLADAKVFVLASGRSASAAEHLVLSLRRTKRATVIGETTLGAGNFGGFENFPGGFRTFVAVGRTFDPDTNKGWDYFGIAPDITVPAKDALTEALVRSGIARPQAEALALQHGPKPEEVTSRREAPASVPGI